jgi:hypothetical protein
MKNKPFRRECYIYGIQESDYVRMERHHLLEGRGRRQISDRYGLVVDLCTNCHYKAHHDSEFADFLHRTGQRKAMNEQGWTTAEFIAVFGKNYLEKE